MVQGCITGISSAANALSPSFFYVFLYLLLLVGPRLWRFVFFWQSMPKGDPSWNGYIYAFSIFAGVVRIIFFSCVLHTTFICWFSAFELPSNHCATCESNSDNPFCLLTLCLPFFSHCEFLLKHNTFRMACVMVSDWGLHWLVLHIWYQSLRSTLQPLLPLC